MRFRGSGVSSSFTLQSSGKSLFLWVGTVLLHGEYPESLFDGTFHIGGESALQTDVLHMGIHIGDVVRIIKEPFKGIRRELLAKSGTVINFPVLVINEGCAINAPFLVFPKYHIYSFSGKQAGKLLPAATATVHGKSHFVPNLRLPFFALYSRTL